jgi:glutathione S-transferase
MMQWTAWTTLASMLMYGWTVKNVGTARLKYKIMAPSMDGPLEFLSACRVQANTIEQMILFLPLLWLCAMFLNDRWAAIGGALWILGRVIYALGYYNDPPKRAVGFGISIVATLGLLIASGVGLLTHGQYL